jgi:hypothetical protein
VGVDWLLISVLAWMGTLMLFGVAAFFVRRPLPVVSQVRDKGLVPWGISLLLIASAMSYLWALSLALDQRWVLAANLVLGPLGATVVAWGVIVATRRR